MDITELKATSLSFAAEIEAIFESLQIPSLHVLVQELSEKASNPEFWSNQIEAKRITGSLANAKAKLARYEQLQALQADLGALIELSQEGNDESLEREAEQLSSRLSGLIEQLKIETYLAGDFDNHGALMTIRSGAGGDDATDFVEMLMRMYLRYCDQQGFRTVVLDTSLAEGAGIKSAVIEITGPYAFGKLSIENGTHRLVRMSPFNAAGKRQTSFAAVEVVPLIEETEEISIPDSEIRVDVFRSSGPGGQSVNTTDSAVRITHIPSGIVVSCQNEKSQLQNKQAAMRVLQSRLLEIKRQEEDAAKRKISGDVKASWGEQMRSYVLAPYQMVKDLRTGYEVNNPENVLGGDLEGFISAGIRWRAAQKT